MGHITCRWEKRGGQIGKFEWPLTLLSGRSRAGPPVTGTGRRTFGSRSRRCRLLQSRRSAFGHGSGRAILPKISWASWNESTGSCLAKRAQARFLRGRPSAWEAVSRSHNYLWTGPRLCDSVQIPRLVCCRPNTDARPWRLF